MTQEATLIFELAPPIPFTVANTTGIEKGAILKMTDPMTAALANGDIDIIAGIAASEKIASDGNTKLGVYRSGIFKVYISGNVTVGDAVTTGAGGGDSNDVITAGVNAENLLGTALETGVTNETILIELNPMGINLA